MAINRNLGEEEISEVEAGLGWTEASLLGKVAIVIGIALCLYIIMYVSGVLKYQRLVYIGLGPHRAIGLGFFLVLTFLTRSAKGGGRRDKLPWYDIVLILMSLLPCWYYAFFQDAIFEHRSQGLATPTEIVLCVMLIVALLESGRRVIDWVLPAMSLIFIIHPLLAQYMPGILYGKTLSIQRIVSVFYLSESGIFGSTLGVATTIVVTFMMFSQFLLTSGASKFFLDLALALVGTVRGGPAKAAIIGSSLFGMISGSPTGNVAAVGTITIPLMKKIGYPPIFAAALEAVSSTGGQIMPPVMGTVAFLMADITGAGYGGVCIAAAVPALLYYLSIYLQVDFRAAKMGLIGVPRSELPSLKQTLKEGWHYLLPIVVLIIMIVYFRYNEERAALLAIVVLYLVTLFRRGSRLGVRKILTSLDESARSSLWAAIPCAVSGIIVASLNVSGVGVTFSSEVVNLAGGSLIALLILAAVASFILGTGLGVVAIYIVLSVLVAPALVQMGVNLLAAHLFIMYWGVMSFITPPVATAAFVAAGIAEVDPWKTGWQACVLGIVAYLVPFMFVMNPSLILEGPVIDSITTVVLAILGVFALSVGVEGYFIRKMNLFPRIFILTGSIILLLVGWKYQSLYLNTSILLISLGFCWHIWKVVLPYRRERVSTANERS